MASFHNTAVQVLPQSELQEIIKFTRPTRAQVSLDNLAWNLSSFHSHLSEHANSPMLLPIIKANGYGHGALPLALQALKQTKNNEKIVAGVAVATLEEAIMLRQQLSSLNISCPLLLLLGVLPRGSEATIAKYNITPSICHTESLKRIIQVSKDLKITQKIHLKLDTGMHRVGMNEQELKENISELSTAVAAGNIELNGIYTHLSKADETNKDYTINQLQSFQRGIDLLKSNRISVRFIHSMNSAGSIDFKQLSNTLPFLNDFNLYRIGISLYGLYPSDEVEKTCVPLKPLMEWTTEVVQVKELGPQKKIGYGGTYETTEQTKIAVLPVGYADGYRRLLGASEDKGAYSVYIGGKICPIVGRVCMDMIMVDVSAVADVVEGDCALLMGSPDGKDVGLHCDDMANRLSTINYEVTCLVGERVPRLYTKDNQLVAIHSLYCTTVAEEFLNRSQNS